MPVPSAIATALLGAGVTLASTFAPSLGLSVPQQRVGFAFGVLLMIVGAVLYFSRRTTPERNNERERAGVEAESRTINVISHNQSGGITAHTVHMSQEPPSLESAIHGDRQFKDGYFITTVVLDLTGYPKRMGLSAESAGSIRGLALRREGSDADLSDVRSRRTEGGGLIRSCGEPQPGRYIAEISTQSDMDRLHIETWLE